MERVRFKTTDRIVDAVPEDEGEDPLREFRPSDTAVKTSAAPSELPMLAGLPH